MKNKLVVLSLLSLLFSFGAMAQGITMTMPVVPAPAANASVSIPIYVTNFDKVGAISLTITYSSDVVSFVGVENTNSALGSGFTFGTQAGIIKLSWYDPTTPRSITGTGTLVNLKFTYKLSAGRFRFSTTPGDCEIAGGTGNVLPVTYQNGYIYTGPAPLLTVNPTSLSFGNVLINTTSGEKTYTVTGSNLLQLTEFITFNAPTGYQISFTSGSGFASSIKIANSGGSLAAKTVYTRFTPTAVQSYNGNITISGSGATVNEAVSGSGVAPTITVSSTSLSFGNVAVNTISSEKTYTVTGAYLTPASGNITITPPSGYEVSTTSGSGFLTSLPIAYTSGTLAAKTIYVRFKPTAAQSYNGNITNAGGGAATVNKAVSGTGIGTLTVNPTSLAFGNQIVSTTSGEKTYTVTGANLSPASGNITITAPSGYQVSTTSGSGFASTKTIAYSGGALASKTVYVRFTPTAAQSYSGNITNSGGGATTKNVAVTGVGIGTLTLNPTSLTFGNQIVSTTSGEKTYTVIGANLSPASGNITITAPSGFQVSTTSGSGFASTKTIAYSGGALASKTVYVRFTPTAAQSYSGNITNSGGGAATKNVAVSGTGIQTPSLSTSPTSIGFGNVVINTSSDNGFTLFAAYLSPPNASVTITAPSGFQVSTTSDSGFASSITPTSQISVLMVYVRFTPTAAQSYSGNITISGGGAPTVNVAVSGAGIAPPPSLTVNPTSLAFGNVTVNTISSEKTYTVTGTNLTPASGKIIIKGSTNFKVSLTSGSGFADSLNISYTGGTLPSKTVYVRFSPTSVSGYATSLTISGGGAATTLPVSGVGVSPPSLTVSPTSLVFGNVTVNTISSEKTYTVTGTNLTPASGNITITAPSGFQVSTTSGSGFATSITVAYSGGALASKTVYIRFTPTAAQSYSGNITNSGGGATTKNVAVTGVGVPPQPTLTVSPTSLVFGNVTVNTISSEKTYMVTGANLSPASGNITITAPSGYQVSTTSGSGFGSSLTVPYTGGSITKTVYARFTPTAAQSYSGNINNSGSGVSANVAVSGTGIQAPSLSTSPTSIGFGNVAINTSSDNGFTLYAAYLSPPNAQVTITAPSGFQVSTTSGSGFAQSITTTSQISVLIVYVRFTPTAAQSYSGNITISGGGASATVAVSGAGIVITYTITVQQNSGGTITPGTTSVNSGGSQTFTITPNTGYQISNVYIDGGTSVGAISSYTFSNVTYARMITAYFGTITYTISGNISYYGSPVTGVTMNGFPQSTSTNSSGNYSTTVPYNWSGTVTPQVTYFTFTPASTTYSNVSSNITTNYTGRLGKRAGNQIVEQPREFALGQNVPNPFNPTSIIYYQLPGENTRFNVSLKVYDIMGREVATLADGMKAAGYYSATFDASGLSSGIYFARIIASPEDSNKPFTKIVKMLLLR